MRRWRPLVAPAIVTAVAIVAAAAAPAGALLAPDVPAFVRTWGSTGAGTTQLNDPIAIDADAAGNYYVADYVNDRVQKFSPTGTFLTQISGPGTGTGQVDQPNGVVVFFDPTVDEQRLLVSDAGNDRLHVFELDGGYVTTKTTFTGATPTDMNFPAEVEVSSTGLFAVADRLGQRVLLLDSSLNLEHEIDLPAHNPAGVAFSPSGDEVYITDSADNVIDVHDTATGGFLRTIAAPGLPSQSVQGPYGLDVDRLGFLYVSNTSTSDVRKFTPTGEWVWSIGGFGTADGKMSSPHDTVVTPDGLLGVADMGNDRIQVFDLCPTGFSDVPESHPFWFEICWMDTQNVSTGYPDGTYRPIDAVSRQAMAAFLYRAAGEPLFSTPVMATFPDVPVGSPFFKEVEWMAAEGIAGGYPDGKFHPAAPVSRQAMSAFMYRAAGSPVFTPPVTPTFDDVAPTHAFFDEIEWMADAGISNGYPDGTYRPTDVVSRQAMSAFLARLALIT